MSNPHTSLPKVAVLMATYNGEKFLAEQIGSILNQESVDVYLYIRDDHSSDGTIDLINALQKKNSNIFLYDLMQDQLRVTKNFYSIVRDTDFAEMDYIAYSDQDDIWLPNKLSKAIESMKNNGSDCYASNLLLGDVDGKIRKRTVFARIIYYLLNHKTNHQSDFDHYLEAASAGCTLVLGKGAAIYFKNRVMILYPKIPSDASHDWSTYAITRLGGFKWYIDRNSYIIYRQHGDNAYGANNGIKGVAKLLDLFRSGWYRRHILMIDELYNEGALHPTFIEQVRNYRQTSLLSRYKIGCALAPYRRKYFHRILLFTLIICGQFR